MNFEGVCEFTDFSGRYLSHSFEQARKSLFPLGKSKFFPNQKHAHKSPWPGVSMTSLIEGDQSQAMLKILKEQHAYVISQHNYLMRTQADQDQAQQLASQESKVADSQAQQMQLVRDVLSGFQESMAVMMQLATEMVNKACEVYAAPIMPKPLPPPPIFQKSAESHRRPVIQNTSNGDIAQAVAKQQVAPLIIRPSNSNADNNPIRVQPHPISKKLERIKQD